MRSWREWRPRARKGQTRQDSEGGAIAAANAHEFLPTAQRLRRHEPTTRRRAFSRDPKACKQRKH
eukprot:2121614-Pyramimonas_sp.AAC.1